MLLETFRTIFNFLSAFFDRGNSLRNLKFYRENNLMDDFHFFLNDFQYLKEKKKKITNFFTCRLFGCKKEFETILEYENHYEM